MSWTAFWVALFTCYVAAAGGVSSQTSTNPLHPRNAASVRLHASAEPVPAGHQQNIGLVFPTSSTRKEGEGAVETSIIHEKDITGEGTNEVKYEPRKSGTGDTSQSSVRNRSEPDDQLKNDVVTSRVPVTQSGFLPDDGSERTELVQTKWMEDSTAHTNSTIGNFIGNRIVLPTKNVPLQVNAEPGFSKEGASSAEESGRTSISDLMYSHEPPEDLDAGIEKHENDNDGDPWSQRRTSLDDPNLRSDFFEGVKLLRHKEAGASHYDLTKLAENPSELATLEALIKFSPPPLNMVESCWYNPSGTESPTPETPSSPVYEFADDDAGAKCQSCELDDDENISLDSNGRDDDDALGLRPPQPVLQEGAAEDQLFVEGLDAHLSLAQLQKILQSGLLNTDTFSAEDRRRRPLADDEGAACKCQVSAEETICTRDNAYCDSLPGSEVPSGILEVSGTNISYLGVNSLLPFHSVSVMKLANNQLERIDPGAFSNMSLLRNLSLSYNRFSELDRNVFTGAQNLLGLLVSYNRFHDLRAVTHALRLETTPNLVHLSVGGNAFFNISRKDFAPMKSIQLRDLQLHESGIRHLEADAFADLQHLSRLRLRHNPVSLYQLRNMLLFMRNSSLEMIDLSGLGRYSILDFFSILNAITYSKITALELNNYCFFSLMKFNFPRMDNIRVLSMADCGLHTIYANTFDRFPSLEQLILTDNHFSYVPSAVIIPQLISLDISRTAFLPDVQFKVYEYQFREMNSLRYLDLSMNNIQFLSRGSFFGLENLTVLMMNDADLHDIEEFTFSMMENLTELCLSRNSLGQQNFEFTWSGLTNLRVLFLDNCSVSSSELYLHNMPQLEQIKMNNNLLRNLTDETFRGLKNLKAVDLSFNAIEPWHNQAFRDAENLTRIYLNNNHLAWVTESMVTDFRNMRVIRLRENPYLCDCMLYDWLLWEEHRSRPDGRISPGWNTSTISSHTSDVADCTCMMPPQTRGTKVLDFYNTTEHSPCEQPGTRMLLAMIPVFLSGVLVAILTRVLWRNRWYIRYWVFKLTSQRWLKRLRGGPASYIYDAFVSYSSEDARLVLEMMDNLEKSPPYYRLCVYERDFEIGNVISECILESINTSRKTILVLSDHFAKSHWCRWEMSLVQCRLFEQKRDDLILVKLGKLRSRHLTPTIKYLMRTRIYIEWGPSAQQQLLFWEKLRAALRQPGGLPQLPRSV